jgi:transposase
MERTGTVCFFLPRYSPYLNLIEILWRKIKHEWLKPKDYETLKSLEEALKNILIGFGRDFFINFKQPEVTII